MALATATREELAWAGGLFEGEGCLSYASHNRGGVSSGRVYVKATLGMKDEDVVQRFADIIGLGEAHPAAMKRPGGDLTVWWVTNFEHFQAVVAALWPWLGERRKARAAELLKARQVSQDLMAERACGEPGCNRRFYSQGVCQFHYHKRKKGE